MEPVLHECFYSKLKGNITCDEYDKFVQDFSERGYKMMIDWLRVYNKAIVIPFIEAIDKTHKQCYSDEIDMLKDVINMPDISMMYVLNKSLKMKQPGELELFAPGQPCFHKCEKCKIWNDCTQCAKPSHTDCKRLA